MSAILSAKLKWFDSLPFNHSDDAIVMLYGVIGLIFIPLLLRELKPVPNAWRFSLVGIAFIIIAAIMDITPDGFSPYQIDRGVEEIAELFTATSFTAAFIHYAVYQSVAVLTEWRISTESHREDRQEIEQVNHR